MSEAYIHGVLDGDGFVDWSNTNPRICLEVTSERFATMFSNELRRIGLTPRLTERDRRCKHLPHPRFQKYDFISHMFVVRATCKTEWVKHLMIMNLYTKEEKTAYLRGFYDSEGSYLVVKYPNRVCYILRIYNTNLGLLIRIKEMLSDFGIKATLGTSPHKVHVLRIQNHNDIQSFFTLIGRVES